MPTRYRTAIIAVACILWTTLSSGAARADLFAAPVDVTSLTAQVAAAKTQAAAAASAAATAQASIPTPMLAVPPTEQVGGAAGTPGTYRTGTAVQPRITRVKTFTTDANGQAVLTWTDMGAVPGILAAPLIVSGSTQVPACYAMSGTITSTGATVQCYITQTLLGLGLVPFAKATAGVTGTVFAIPNS